MFRRFENLVDPYVSYDETDAPPQRVLPFLMDYARPFRRVFVLAGILSVVVAAVEISLIYYLGRVVDLLSSGAPVDVWEQHGTELIAVAFFVMILRPLVQTLDVLVLNNSILPNFGTLVRWRAHKQVLRQSVGWFENDFAGRIANRVTQTPPAAGEVAFQVFDALTFALAYLIGAAVMLAEADLRLAIPLLIWFSLYIVLVRWTVRRVGPASKASSDARSTVTGRIVDSYTNIHAVKMFAHHSRELSYARDAIENTRRTFMAEMRLYTIMDVSLVCLNGLLIVGVVGWGVALWLQGSATTGMVAAATALTLRLNAMTGWIMWAVTTLFRQLGVVSEGMETIAQPIDLTDSPGAGDLSLTAGEIRFEGVSHHYGRGSGGLDRLTLTVKPGEKVGLVGRSGAGKSTAVKLLLRFYDPEAGRIMIDDQDITNVRQDSLRRNIGMVQQETALLHRSIAENILYGKPDAGEASMRAAAEQASALEFIEDLNDALGNSGFDAQVGERGVKLSGGQRQRIALARVILKDAPILVLDEATSALDSEVEASIQEALYGIMADKTVIAIAHRLSTIARMDRIVVIDEGRIVEEGSHADLLAKNGLYAQFWARQSGGFIGVSDAAE